MLDITGNSAIAAGLEINPRGFVFNPTNGDTYTANEVAVHILQLMQQGMDEEGIVSIVAKTFDADESEVRSDLKEFLKSLMDLNIMGDGS